jgi:hypothetical protein
MSLAFLSELGFLWGGSLPYRLFLHTPARPGTAPIPGVAIRSTSHGLIPDRGPVCLTAREPSCTLPLDEKGRLKFLYLGRFKCSSYIAHSEHGRDRGKSLVIHKLLDFTHG